MYITGLTSSSNAMSKGPMPLGIKTFLKAICATIVYCENLQSDM